MANELSSVFPLEKLKERFGGKTIHYSFGKDDLNKIIEKKSSDISGLSLNVWNRIVQYKLYAVDPKAISDYVDDNNPYMFEKISEIVGENIIQDINYQVVYVDDDALENKKSSELLIAYVYPNDIHIADLEFSDPYKPINLQDRKTRFQEYEGLGMLELLLHKIERLGLDVRREYITLTAASPDHVPLFEKFGFSIEDNEAAKFYLENGLGVPMEKLLDN